MLLPVTDWPIIMIGPGGLLLVVSHLFAVPDSSFSFMGRVGKKQITRLGCERYFLQVHILSTAGDALTLPCCFIHTLYMYRRSRTQMVCRELNWLPVSPKRITIPDRSKVVFSLGAL
jgi:hypothetical protein